MKREGDQLVAEIRGNLEGILGFEACDLGGAGSPVVAFSNWRLARTAVG